MSTTLENGAIATVENRPSQLRCAMPRSYEPPTAVERGLDHLPGRHRHCSAIVNRGRADGCCCRFGHNCDVPVTVTAVELAAHVRRLRDGTPRTVLVAIDGEGGAGKSTLASLLAATLGGATVVCLDDFARPTVPGWDRQRMIRQVLDPLRTGRPGRYQRWDWATDAGAEWHDVPTGGVVIVEGVSATRQDLSDRWDLTVWVSTPRDLRLERGLARDGDAMRRQWLDVWMPEEDAYVAGERPAERADFIVDGR